MVEYHVANVVVVGSIPITRSRGELVDGRFTGMVPSGPWEALSPGPLVLFGQARLGFLNPFDWPCASMADLAVDLGVGSNLA